MRTLIILQILFLEVPQYSYSQSFYLHVKLMSTPPTLNEETLPPLCSLFKHLKICFSGEKNSRETDRDPHSFTSGKRPGKERDRGSTETGQMPLSLPLLCYSRHCLMSDPHPFRLIRVYLDVMFLLTGFNEHHRGYYSKLFSRPFLT